MLTMMVATGTMPSTRLASDGRRRSCVFGETVREGTSLLIIGQVNDYARDCNSHILVRRDRQGGSNGVARKRAHARDLGDGIFLKCLEIVRHSSR